MVVREMAFGRNLPFAIFWRRQRNMMTSSSTTRTTALLMTRRWINFSFYEERSGDTIAVKADKGKRVLDVALDNNIDIEGFIFDEYIAFLILS